MGIQSVADYVKFYVGLDMKDSISLSSFVYNEKLVLKNKLDLGRPKKEQIMHGLKLLDELLSEIHEIGEHAVVEKYSKQ